MKKKIISGLLSTAVLASAFAAPANAAVISMGSDAVTNEEVAADMESVLLEIKGKIEIPAEFTEFTYDYQSNTAYGQYWSFVWRDKDFKNSLSIKCDKDGNIFSYNLRNNKEKNSVPKFLKEELKATAEAFIEKVLPAVSGHLQFQEASFNGVYSGSYTYQFDRMENGILMPDNSVRVSVDYETGEVVGLSASWEYHISIPDSEVKISKEEAQEKIGEKVEMKLTYRNKTEKVGDKTITKAYLVYQPDKSYMAVDAKTGEIYETKNEYLSMEMTKNESIAEDSANNKLMSAAGLSEQEVAKIEELKNLISKKEAIKVVENDNRLLFDEHLNAVSANLYQKYDENKEAKDYLWRITFNDVRGDVDYQAKDSFRAYASATVNAETGELISYRSNVRSSYDYDKEDWNALEVKYTKAEAQEMLESFLKEKVGDKFKKSVLSDEPGFGYILKYIENEPVYGGYDFRYNRVNEGVEYTYNQIYGSVDGVTGKIYSFGYYWDDEVIFESPKATMSPEEAYKHYADKEGFELVYEINQKHYISDAEDVKIQDKYRLEKEMRLVYRTNINPSAISPFSGKQLSYDGEEYKKVTEKNFTDISGHWAERAIRLITDLNVRFEEEEFLPKKAVSEKEFVEALNQLGYYSRSEEKEEDTEFTKLDALKKLIDQLNLTKVAKLQNIYKTEGIDLTNMNPEDVGYVALARGLGIVSGEFVPNKELTRAEFAVILMNLLHADV
ncbi:MAG: hypothetical protein J6M02_03270 [Clostridia bacterium]|nr:hypothetical protein [Clostridia bacterium]